MASAKGKGGVGFEFIVTDKDGTVIQRQSSGPIEFTVTDKDGTVISRQSSGPIKDVDLKVEG